MWLNDNDKMYLCILQQIKKKIIKMAGMMH